MYPFAGNNAKALGSVRPVMSTFLDDPSNLATSITCKHLESVIVEILCKII